MLDLIELAAKECCLPIEWINNVLHSGPSRVKKLKIPKKNKRGFRVVSRPSAELEILQRWVVFRFFSKNRIHPSAMAFLPRRSILSNAVLHRDNKYFIRVDFKDFFPSIKLPDLITSLLNDKNCVDPITNYHGYHRFLKQVCFDESESLPIGYISSPIVSNLVMWNFDADLSQLVIMNSSSLGNGRLSRYADDIIFSTDKKDGCRKFLELLRIFIAKQKNPALKINEGKTLFTSKAKGTAIVTGLRICADNHITITKKQKDHVRLMLSLNSKKSLNKDEFTALRGHLAFARHVAPAFYSKLCIKYADSISEFI